MQRDTQRDRDDADPDAGPSTVDADAGSTLDADRRLVDVETELLDGDADDGTDADAGDGSGLRGRLGSVVPSPSVDVPLAPVSFVLVTVALLAGLVAGAAVPILGAVPVVGGALRFVGLFAVAFGIGLVGSRRRYAEVGAGALLASGLAFVPAVARPLVRGIASLVGASPGEVGLLVTGVGAGTGLLVALAGYHFGRDLRDGLTRDV